MTRILRRQLNSCSLSRSPLVGRAEMMTVIIKLAAVPDESERGRPSDGGKGKPQQADN